MGFIAGLIRWVGICAASIMVMSFVLFATDESGSATKGQVNKLDSREAPVATLEPKNEFRQKLDNANAKLSQPFDWATENIGSNWARNGLTMLMGVLVYGLGFAWLANLVPKPKMREPTPWHT